MNERCAVTVLLVLCLGMAGCAGSAEPQDGGSTAAADLRRVDVYLEGKSGSDLYGTAIFIKEGEKITVQVKAENTPPGDHAVHIHEKGDCSADDGTSAGGHWNPTSENHGKWGEAPYHLGDIGNLKVGDDGVGSLMLTTGLWTMGGGAANDIIGKAVIVHAGADDFTTQPTGAAGGRIGCGVIEK